MCCGGATPIECILKIHAKCCLILALLGGEYGGSEERCELEDRLNASVFIV